MQEDHLLSGSIADNICFFDATFNQERLIACAQLPGIIHDEIMAMPMSYNSLIGDGALSRGQKQRVACAGSVSATKTATVRRAKVDTCLRIRRGRSESAVAWTSYSDHTLFVDEGRG
jgi:hypothetical protein